MKTKMNNEELRALNQDRKIYQIAWVTRDLEKSMKAWVENLKIGPWMVLTFTEKSLKYLKVDDKPVTEPFKFLIGISWIGDMQLSTAQPSMKRSSKNMEKGCTTSRNGSRVTLSKASYRTIGIKESV
jgi:hypothetical protein